MRVPTSLLVGLNRKLPYTSDMATIDLSERIETELCAVATGWKCLHRGKTMKNQNNAMVNKMSWLRNIQKMERRLERHI